MNDGTLTWRQLRAEAEERLRALGVTSPEAEARWIVEELSGETVSLLDVDAAVTQRAVAAFDRMLARRETGEPLQYVLGRWAFRTLDLMVDRRVLIPRPETEVVAGAAIEEVRQRNGPTVVADLGTGSGAIAMAVATECWPHVEVWATEVSGDALAVASANLAGLGRAATAVRLCEGSWYEALPPDLRGTIDVIVSNPPYVADDDALPREVSEWEPATALFSGPDGTSALRTILDGAHEWLTNDGVVVLELDPRQVDAMSDHARRAGFTNIELRRDLTDRARCLICR